MKRFHVFVRENKLRYVGAKELKTRKRLSKKGNDDLKEKENVIFCA